MSFFPSIGLLNTFHLGDSVILEPIAELLSESLGVSVSVVSRHKDLFKYHPNIVGVDLDDLDEENLRVINLTDEIGHRQDIQYKELNNAIGTKLSDIYTKVGINCTQAKGAKLYLSRVEQKNADMYRSLFRGPLVGIVPTSRFAIKNWPYMRVLIKQLVKKKYSVFVFADELTYHAHCMLRGLPVYRVVGKDLREMMTWLSVMDVVVGPDTGPVHIAGALEVPTVVAVYKKFRDLYEPTARCVALSGRRGLFGISARKMLRAITESIETQKKKSPQKVLICRWRGIGDVLLTLPAIATLKAQDPYAEYSYVTSPACAKILKTSKVLDNVIGIEYQHDTSGKPRLPDGLNIESYSCVYNLVNRVDFEPETAIANRAKMFGELLDVEKVDYSTDWKIKFPYSWQRSIRMRLMKLGLLTNTPYIALQVSSAGWSRVWQKERWHNFVRLAAKEGFKTVLLSDMRIDDAPEEAYNLTGECSIEEYVGAIAASQIFIGPDSSGIHIAGSMDHPAIGLFGSVDPKLRISHYDSVIPIVGKAKCVPCNDTQFHSCREEEHHPTCMWSIQPEEVLHQAIKLIRKGAKDARKGKR